MCIIMVKPKNVQMPKRNILENCWDNNPDGAGLMFPKNGKIVIDKGYMEKEKLLARLKKLEKEVNLYETPLVLHCRIKTSGKVNPSCTHPFPLADNFEYMKQLRSTSDIGIAHNGVISMCETSKKESDTMIFTKNYLFPLQKKIPNMLEDKLITDLITEVVGKMAVMTVGQVYLFGHFYKKDGIYYSNSTYEKNYSYKYGSYYSRYYDYFDYTDHKECKNRHNKLTKKSKAGEKEGYMSWCIYCQDYVLPSDLPKGLDTINLTADCPTCKQTLKFFKVRKENNTP